ncbi:GntR family transcriptional regulator [Pseudoteredinibacter isoporae]|uniref:GntR family transcriptional regulator n=1 Tax=Pseudoteredinibacter isoporae TaxID=570281 RepID=UPI003104C55F
MAIVHKTRSQLVVESIREKILNGEIKSGEPLRQAALAEELNVSRIPVREALLQLEGEGLVHFEPHKGATATEVSAEQVDELFELRAMLEAELLKHAFDSLTEDDFVKAEYILDRLAKQDDENTQSHSGELNLDFHQHLYQKAKRPQTQEMVRTLNKSADRYVRMHLMLAGGFTTAAQEHRKILELCRAGKRAEACEFLQQHILNAKEDIKALLLKMEA